MIKTINIFSLLYNFLYEKSHPLKIFLCFQNFLHECELFFKNKIMHRYSSLGKEQIKYSTIFISNANYDSELQLDRPKRS